MKKSRKWKTQGAYYKDIGITSLLIAISLVFISSCSSKNFDTKEALLSYTTDKKNGYHQTKSVNGYDFSLLYKPTDVLVQQELSEDISQDQIEEKVKELRKKYHNYLYFSLSISKNDREILSTTPKDRNEFGAMVNQLAFGMREKAHLFTQSKDTLEMIDFIYPRMYGMSRSTDILFVYPRNHEQLEEDNLSFTLEDLGTYTGEVKFKIPTDIINNEPVLSFKK